MNTRAAVPSGAERADTGTVHALRRLPAHPAYLVGLAVITALAIYIQLTYVPVDTRVFGLFRNQLDLRVYRAGAEHLLDGRPIYDQPVLGHMDYTYPPFSTVVLSPFAWMSRDAAVVVWTLLIVAALLWVVVGSFRVLGYRLDVSLAATAVALVSVSLLMEPVRTTIWYGQVNVFLMALVLWDLLRPDGSRLKGVTVGLAAGVKLTPAFFAVYLLATRRFRAVVVAALTGVVTVVVGALFVPRQSWTFWTDKIFDSQRVGPNRNPANQSIRGALAHVFGTDHPSNGLWVLMSAIAVVLGLTAAYLAHRHGNELLALCLVGMTTTAVSPFSWGHHWVWFVPLLVVSVDLVVRAWQAHRPVRAVALLALPVALMAGTFMWRLYLPGGFAGLRPFYGIGLFMNPVPSWFRWFGAQPYLCIFGITALVTIAVSLTRAPSESRVRPDAGGATPADPVGGRR